MLVSFSVSNFRSFAEEETFSLVASKRSSGTHGDHAVPIPDSSEHVLRAAVLYGANGAGKSNLFKALKYVSATATRARKKNAGTGRVAFRLGTDASAASVFDVQFVANSKLYRYGLKVTDDSVVEEWLLHVRGERERVLYERTTGAEGKVTIEAAEELKKNENKFGLLAAIGGPHNQSFLATARATLEVAELPTDISAVLEWFSSTLRLTGPSENIEPVGHMLTTDDDFCNFASNFLRSSSTGVDQLTVEKQEITEDDLEKWIPKSILVKLLDDIRANPDGTAVVQLPEGTELIVERTDTNHFYRINIQAEHRSQNGETTQLPLKEESDGTRRLLELIPALHFAKSGGAVYFVDEIDRSMHPMLVWKFLQFFFQTCCGRDSQIIVTTHESNLLDLDLLRRDEIWFVEKDEFSRTRLYSLSDFKVRKDLEIRKHYLNGRFGAVPFLGDIDRLLDKAQPNVIDN